MRFAIAIATFGFIASLPVAAPVFTPAAVAQSAVTAEEQTLQAQMVALAQAGDVAGLRALLANQIRLGNAAVVARVSRRVATLAQQISSTDPVASSQLINAAVIFISNPSVSAVDPTGQGTVGSTAANIVNTIQTTDPNAAASVQTTVAVEGTVDVQIGYTSPVTTPTDTDTTTTTPTVTTPTPTTGNDTPPVIRPPLIPTAPDIPIPVEPNPQQGGSPV